MTALVDTSEFCRACGGDKWDEDGYPCYLCGGSGNKSIMILNTTRRHMNIPEEREWRRDNPRCFDCGATENLTVVCEAYHPEPAAYRCKTCLEDEK